MNRWERKLAWEVARSKLEREYMNDAIVRNYLMMAIEGDLDLLTALTECIKVLVKARVEAHDMLARQVGLMEVFIGEDHVAKSAVNMPPARVSADPFLSSRTAAGLADSDCNS